MANIWLHHNGVQKFISAELTFNSVFAHLRVLEYLTKALKSNNCVHSVPSALKTSTWTEDSTDTQYPKSALSSKDFRKCEKYIYMLISE